MPTMVQESTIFDIPLRIENLPAILRAAPEYGWEGTEVGQFATVLFRGNHALKIFQDSAYADYLDHFALSGKNVFPLIIDGPYIAERIGYVIIEKLERIDMGAESAMLEFQEFHMENMQNESFLIDHPTIEKIRSIFGDEFLEAFDSIREFAAEFGYLLDIKPSNIMHRPSTNSYVITDPVWW